MKVCVVTPLPPPYGGMAVQGEKLIARLRAEGIYVVEVPTNPELPSFLSIAEQVPYLRTILRTCVFLFLLSKAIKKTEVIYFLSGFLNFFFWVTLPAIALAKLMGKPFILNARGGGAPVFFKSYRTVLNPVIKSLDLVTVPSGYLEKTFKENCGARTVIIPNIADLDQFRFVRRKTLRPRFIITRNLEPYYNVACAIRGFSIIRESYPDAILGIAGTGSLEQELKQLIIDLDLERAVIFHGQIPHKDIPPLYQDYDIMINTSDVDNQPGVILEAFASGLPVVTTDAGGIPFLIENEVSGLLIPRNDHRALAEKCIYLLQTPEIVSTLAENGLKNCRIHTWEHIRTILIPWLRKVHG